MEKYEIKQIGGLDWYYLGESERGQKFLLKEVLDEERIKKYADDEFMYKGCGVRHQDKIRPFDWDKSYIKNVILMAFKEDLDLDCEVDLLSKEEVEKLPMVVRECNNWYWTKTRYSSISNGAFRVHASGYVYDNNVNTANAVRPVLYLKSSQFLTEEVRDESYRSKIEHVEDTLVDVAESLRAVVDNLVGTIDLLKQIRGEE